ncbi:hypothetical protein CAEBREN_31615 [Caenorhabditis brenneri]|uniref:B30.2/SPRY domain-containing protein n=1 Tax=Caenorhabditis brenneri TaxID=135651 RepID=G0PMG3_CAEBE|nr:hypothetical protein CAEBREN_31615 [Caenorhabditis brenneri]
MVIYEGGAAVTQARSLWRVELVRMKWHGALVGWEQVFRIKHITSGRYLGVLDNAVQLYHKEKADFELTAFVMCQNKDPKKQMLDEKEEEGMGNATIRYGETNAFIQHVKTQLWLSYQTSEVTKKGLGKVEEKKAVALKDGHMDDCYTFFMALEEESKSARVIRKCSSVLNKFLKGIDALQLEGNKSADWTRVDLNEVLKLMEDLIEYFAQPNEEQDFEEKQNHLRALRSRQDLFQEEGVLNMILDTIDKFSQMEALPDFADLIGEDTHITWEQISTYLYLLVAAMIKGNHYNCAQFASAQRLDWLFGRLSNPQSAEGILDVLYCVLTESPEALNMINEGHIRSVISLLEKVGRDPKVLDVLSSLCEGNGMAVRSSQNLITQYLLPGKDLLLQTSMRDHVSSMMPNVMLGVVEGSALFRKWYFEAEVEHIETMTKQTPYLRIGWANSVGFKPFPGSGDKWGCNGVGDDFYSYGFDGKSMFFGGKSRIVGHKLLEKGDVVGCSIDLTVPEIKFSVNGTYLSGVFKKFNIDGYFFPVMSLSAKVSCRFILGGNQGRLRYGPPPGFSAVVEAVNGELGITDCLSFGDLGKNIFCGPQTIFNNLEPFIPTPIDVSTTQLTHHAMEMHQKYAENLHELWAMRKIELGWSYGENRSETSRKHPCLTRFELLPETEKKYNIMLALTTMKTIEALGYHLITDDPPCRLRAVRLQQNFQQSNGYKPGPLDTHEIQLPAELQPLIEALARNTHNVWAKEKIKRGWTFGLSEHVDATQKRSPHLVPYEQVDERIKQANRESAAENIRALQLFGIFLEPPAHEHDEVAEKELRARKDNTRTYRAEATYAVNGGKWYFEFEILTAGYMKIGWMDVGSTPEIQLGADDRSYAFDGYLGRKWHQGAETYGKEWKIGDVVGCFLDLNDRTISFSLNGELLLDPSGSEMAFDNVVCGDGLVPAMTLGSGQRGRLNFGQQSNSLKYFTTCGLQEGYEPFCVNMYRTMPMWFAKQLPRFEDISALKSGSLLEVSRIPATGTSPPCLKILQKVTISEGGPSEKAKMEYIRLSLPVKCNDTFVKNKDKDAIRRQLQDYKPRSQSVVSQIRAPGIPKEFEENKEKKGFLRSMLGSKDSHESDDDRRSRTTSKQPSIEGDEPPAVSQRRRVLTLMNFGMYSFDESILTWLHVNEEDNHKWQDVLRRSLLELPHEERQIAEDHMRDMSDRHAEKPKKGGILSRLRDSSNTRKKDSDRRKDKEAALRQMKSNSRSFDAGSLDTSTLPTGQKDVLGKDPIWVLQDQFHDEDTVSGEQNVSPFLASLKLSLSLIFIFPFSNFLLSFTAAWYSQNQTIFTEIAMEKVNMEKKGSIIPMEAQLDVLQEGDAHALVALKDKVDEYYYGLRIFPGQDPSQVWVGWVTTQYHYYNLNFNGSQGVRKCRFSEADHHGTTVDSVQSQNCYMVNVSELLATTQDVQNTKVLGTLIGCIIDTSIGELSFQVGTTDTGIKFKLEPGAMLFPAVFVTPTAAELVQFELGRIKYTFPLSAAMFKSCEKSLVPFCPPRLSVEQIEPVYWAREKGGGGGVEGGWRDEEHLHVVSFTGWSVLCNDPVRIMSVYIPEKDQSLDILEMIEMPDMLEFHRQTLNLYCKLASHGNHKVAHTLCQHIDEDQIMYAIKSHYLSGPMRQGFHDLLIGLHLMSHTAARNSMAKEYVIPLVPQLQIKNVLDPDSESRYPQITGQSVSMLSQMASEPVKKHVSREDEMKLLPPSVDFDALKKHVMESLQSATHHAVMNCRDLIGGDNTNHFEPLFKLFDQLLVIGLINDEELEFLLRLIHPQAFDETYENGTTQKGLTQLELAEPVKLQLVSILDHLCDIQLRYRIESLVAFTEGFVGELQSDQCKRYMEIKQTDMPPAEAAKKTKEFRCPPKEQMFRLLMCKMKEEKDPELMEEDADVDQCPMAESLQQQLRDFCELLVGKIGNSKEGDTEEQLALIESEEGSWVDSFARIVVKVPPPLVEEGLEMQKKGTQNFREIIVTMLREWAQADFIESKDLIRCMFKLLLRQYSGIREIRDAMSQTYVFHERNAGDVTDFIVYLIQIRELLTVQFEHTEEAILKRGLWKLMNNRIFFQHPDLMRLLSVHENVMSIMMNILTAQQGTVEHEGDEVKEKAPIKDASEMVVACSRFLCYFCRTSRQNQKAMFEHLSFLLDNATMLLARPSLRGSVPLDVAYSSFMDNNELALALKEEELDKVAVYLSRCGLQPNSELITKGYPDIGWDPVEGERYIDFLRFCVWINGENVEENANLVIRLLIRRPECLGVALKGEGQGLFSAFKEAIALSEDIRLLENDSHPSLLTSGLLGENPTYPSKDAEGEDYIDLGAATLDFYSSLVDLLAKCAPDPMAIQAGKGDSLRARAILRSLISLEDLGQILALRFTIPNLAAPSLEAVRRANAVQASHTQKAVMVGFNFRSIDGGQYSLIRGQALKSWNSFEFANQMIVPVLTTMFAHLARNHFGTDLLLDDIQAACYKILDSLYMVTGLNSSISHRKSISSESEKHRPGLGQCLAAFASCFPVAFLEPEFNKSNKFSVLAKSQDQSVQVQEMLQNLSTHIPHLEKLLTDLETVSNNNTMYSDVPNVYDVDLPLMCSYMAHWFSVGPDGKKDKDDQRASVVQTTSVSCDHINRIFNALLKMIRNHVGIENAPWLCRVNCMF